MLESSSSVLCPGKRTGDVTSHSEALAEESLLSRSLSTLDPETSSDKLGVSAVATQPVSRTGREVCTSDTRIPACPDVTQNTLESHVAESKCFNLEILFVY